MPCLKTPAIRTKNLARPDNLSRRAEKEDNHDAHQRLDLSNSPYDCKHFVMNLRIHTRICIRMYINILLCTVYILKHNHTDFPSARCGNLEHLKSGDFGPLGLAAHGFSSFAAESLGLSRIEGSVVRSTLQAALPV